jgi:hypothetical protein
MEMYPKHGFIPKNSYPVYAFCDKKIYPANSPTNYL